MSNSGYQHIGSDQPVCSCGLFFVLFIGAVLTAAGIIAIYRLEHEEDFGECPDECQDGLCTDGTLVYPCTCTNNKCSDLVIAYRLTMAECIMVLIFGGLFLCSALATAVMRCCKQMSGTTVIVRDREPRHGQYVAPNPPPAKHETHVYYHAGGPPAPQGYYALQPMRDTN